MQIKSVKLSRIYVGLYAVAFVIALVFLLYGCFSDRHRYIYLGLSLAFYMIPPFIIMLVKFRKQKQEQGK